MLWYSHTLILLRMKFLDAPTNPLVPGNQSRDWRPSDSGHAIWMKWQCGNGRSRLRQLADWLIPFISSLSVMLDGLSTWSNSNLYTFNIYENILQCMFYSRNVFFYITLLKQPQINNCIKILQPTIMECDLN